MKFISGIHSKAIGVNNLDTTKEIVYINGDSSGELLRYFIWVDDGSPCGVKIE